MKGNMARSVALCVIGKIIWCSYRVREAARSVLLLREIYSLALPDSDCVVAIFFLYFDQFGGDLIHRPLQLYLLKFSCHIAFERLEEAVWPVEPGDGGASLYTGTSFTE